MKMSRLVLVRMLGSPRVLLFSNVITEVTEVWEEDFGPLASSISISGSVSTTLSLWSFVMTYWTAFPDENAFYIVGLSGPNICYFLISITKIIIQFIA